MEERMSSGLLKPSEKMVFLHPCLALIFLDTFNKDVTDKCLSRLDGIY
jgi:hypothetical protein